MPLSADGANSAYWKQRLGDDYRQQQWMRRTGENALHSEYAVQEAFLLRQVELLKGATSPFRVLDFGCGFGRMAPLLTELEGVSYTGYDFSESMAGSFMEQARAFGEPERLSVHVGETLASALPHGDAFDLVFTVAVLMHNAPEAARTLLEQMLDCLKPGGHVLLVENPVSSESRMGNFWHGGSWIHDIVRDLAPDLDVTVFGASIPGQAAYLMRRPDAGRDRLLYLRDAADNRWQITAEDVETLGAPAVAQAQAAFSAEQRLGPADMAEYHDTQEVFRALSSKLLAKLHENGVALDVKNLKPWEVYNHLISMGVLPEE